MPGATQHSAKALKKQLKYYTLQSHIIQGMNIFEQSQILYAFTKP